MDVVYKRQRQENDSRLTGTSCAYILSSEAAGLSRHAGVKNSGTEKLFRLLERGHSIGPLFGCSKK